MRQLVKENPDWRIYSILSHEPSFTAADFDRVEQEKITWEKLRRRQLICLDEEPFLDEFGCHVYIRFGLGALPDQDLRYEEGYTVDPEIFKLESDDILCR